MKYILYVAAIIFAFIAPSSATQAADLTVGITGKGSAQDWPIYIAKSQGFFAAHHLSVALISAPSAANVILQLVAGSFDIGTGGLTDPMRAIDQGAHLSLLRVLSPVPPFTLWGKPSIHNIKELRGKLVMIGGTKDITRIYLRRMMVPNGLKNGDYDLIYAGSTFARYSALRSGAVDAAILLPPFSFRAQDAGYSDLGDVMNYVKDLPFTGCAVNTEWAATHKALLLGFLDSVAKGVSWFYDPANQQSAIEILMKQSGANRSDVSRTYNYYTKIKMFNRKGVMTRSQVSGLAEAMKSLGDLSGSTDFNRFVDPNVASIVAETK